MEFERGKDPKETMEVGLTKTAPKVYEVSYVRENTHYVIKYPSGRRAFLKNLEKLDIPKDPIFGIQEITIKTDVNGNSLLYELAGKSVSCDGGFFAIPTKREIIEAGLEHLFDNEVYTRRMEDEERRAREQELKIKLADHQAQMDSLTKMAEAMTKIGPRY